jgi:hypothetical protein
MTNQLLARVEPLLMPGEVAEIFRVDAKTVTRWAKDGRIIDPDPGRSSPLPPNRDPRSTQRRDTTTRQSLGGLVKTSPADRPGRGRDEAGILIKSTGEAEPTIPMSRSSFATRTRSRHADAFGCDQLSRHRLDSRLSWHFRASADSTDLTHPASLPQAHLAANCREPCRAAG